MIFYEINIKMSMIMWLLISYLLNKHLMVSITPSSFAPYIHSSINWGEHLIRDGGSRHPPRCDEYIAWWLGKWITASGWLSFPLSVWLSNGWGREKLEDEVQRAEGNGKVFCDFLSPPFAMHFRSPLSPFDGGAVEAGCFISFMFDWTMKETLKELNDFLITFSMKRPCRAALSCSRTSPRNVNWETVKSTQPRVEMESNAYSFKSIEKQHHHSAI